MWTQTVALAAMLTACASHPHGMMPRELRGESQRVHAAVRALLGTFRHHGLERACAARLEHLRALVARGDLEEAIDLSLALDDEAVNRTAPPRAALPETHPCRGDQPHVGDADILSQVSTPHGRRAPRGKAPTYKLHIRLHREERGKTTLLPLVHASRKHGESSSRTRVPVVGFELDGTFILADAQLRCHASAEGLSCRHGTKSPLNRHGKKSPRADDVRGVLGHGENTWTHGRRAQSDSCPSTCYSQTCDYWNDDTCAKLEASYDCDCTGCACQFDDYTRGTKSVLVIPIYPKDGNAAADTYPKGFCYDRVRDDHGCDIQSYTEQTMSVMNNFYKNQSWGQMSLEWTITPPMQINYTSETCGNHEGLAYHYGPSSESYATALDVLAYEAAALAGYDFSSYTFQTVVMPMCSAQGFAGVGWVGTYGTLINLYAYDYDAAFAHEIGHNLGAEHASSMYGGSRGAVAWEDSESTWVEYENPHSTMGNGDLEESKGDFVAAGKYIFDWIDASHIVEIEPFGGRGDSQCSPCGPYNLARTDAAESTGPPTEGPVALMIHTGTTDRYFWVEHRYTSTGGNAALVTWSDIEPDSHFTGGYGNSVLTDCTPGTSSWTDAGCAPGSEIFLDVGTLRVSQEIILEVGEYDSSTGLLPVSVHSDFTSAPTLTPRPTPGPTPPICMESCHGYTCDTLVTWGYACSVLETDYGCDCAYCACAGEPSPSATTPAPTDQLCRHATEEAMGICISGGGTCYSNEPLCIDHGGTYDPDGCGVHSGCGCCTIPLTPTAAPGNPTAAPLAAPTGYGDGRLGGGDDALGGDCSSCYSQGTMTGQNGWVADHNYYRRGHSRRHVTLR